MLIWRNRQQKKKAPVNKYVEAENYELEENAEEDITVTDEVAELPEADVTSTVVRKSKKAKP